MSQSRSLKESRDLSAATGLTVIGTSGDDILTGSTEDDVIRGWDGHDVLHGDGGKDVLEGRNGHDELYGGAGDDDLYGGAGNDLQDGGAGNDWLSDKSGDDTYVFGFGSGSDLIYDYEGTDTIRLGAGISATDITLSGTYSLYLTLNATGEQLEISSHLWSADRAVEFLEFADGTIWDQATMQSRIQATDGNDILFGTSLADVKNGLAGDDEIFGYAGDDTLAGGDGNDTLWGGEGNDRLIGRAGEDELRGEAGNDTLIGGSNFDRLLAGEGNDRLDGKHGYDYLEGGAGNDTYLFGIGSGEDRVLDSAGRDTVRLGAGITTADVTIARDSFDLYLTLNATGEQMRIEGQYDGFLGGPIESIVFDDGTIWKQAAIAQMFMQATEGADELWAASGGSVLNGLGGNDSLYGDAGSDTLTGGSGNDWILGGDGGDTLDGGTGNDILRGSWGDDTYVFGLGYGSDSIQDDAFGTETLRLGAGITTDDVVVSRSGLNNDDLTLTLKATGEKIVVQQHFEFMPIEYIRFDDGTIWNQQKLWQIVLTGTSGNDWLEGSPGDDVITGLDGSDSLHGEDGNDILWGGDGNDLLVGHGGNDILDGGSGDDFLYGELGNDSLTGGAGNDRFILWSSTNSIHTVLDYEMPNDEIQLASWNFSQLGGPGVLNAAYFVSSATGDAVDANDYILYENDTGKLFYDADGNGMGAKVQFALIGTGAHAALTASEFVLF